MNPDKITGYWKAAGWLLVLVIVALSLTPAPPHLGVENEDKFGHLAAYGGTMLWFTQVYLRTRQRWICALGLVALGIGLEFAQRATGYRTFEIADMVADAMGVMLGWLAAPPRSPNFLAWAEKRVAR